MKLKMKRPLYAFGQEGCLVRAPKECGMGDTELLGRIVRSVIKDAVKFFWIQPGKASINSGSRSLVSVVVPAKVCTRVIGNIAATFRLLSG